MNEEISIEKKLYLFELDDVLFAKRDYFVQVYYLFSSFYAFTEGNIQTNEMAQFMAKIYDLHGADHVFTTTKTIFNIEDKYEDNYNRLIANAQLPLKLELLPSIRTLLSKLVQQKKHIAILTKGNPIEQLNKLKHLDMEELSSLRNTLKVYFSDELNYRGLNPIEYIAQEFNITSHEIKQII